MADPKSPKNQTPPFFNLPPGCRFYPSVHQLFSHYLTLKNHDPLNFNDVIREVELYNHDPFDLPDYACFAYGYRARRRHWYCFTAAAAVAAEGRERRSAGGGYWRRKSKVRDLGIGTRTSFVFYLANSGKSGFRRTDWVMYEYALADHHLKAFVLCRIFVKPRRENTLSDHVISSCAEESVTTVRHIGVQLQNDETVSSDVAHADAKSDGRKDILEFPLRAVPELDDLVAQGTFSVSKFEVPSKSYPTELVRPPRLQSDSAVFIDPVSTHHLESILEGDFIELDDLIFPLLGTDDIG